MKKLVALFLAMALCLSVVCAMAEAVDPATIEDTITSADGTYVVAFVTDVGQLKDKSFNEGTWNGAKLYAAENNLTYKYYQPANGDAATDDDRYDAMKAAAEAGAKAIVCAGFMQGTALEKAAKEFTDVKFIFIDGWAMGLDNVIGVAFKEEQCGYLAGYAAVMDGYEKLGFSGGGGGEASVDNVGYSIPISKAEPILEELMNLETKEKVAEEEKGYLGIRCADVNQETSERYNIPVGVYVREIAEDGPAAEAGLVVGDVITKIDGKIVSAYSDLEAALS